MDGLNCLELSCSLYKYVDKRAKDVVGVPMQVHNKNLKVLFKELTNTMFPVPCVSISEMVLMIPAIRSAAQTPGQGSIRYLSGMAVTEQLVSVAWVICM